MINHRMFMDFLGSKFGDTSMCDDCTNLRACMLLCKICVSIFSGSLHVYRQSARHRGLTTGPCGKDI